MSVYHPFVRLFVLKNPALRLVYCVLRHSFKVEEVTDKRKAEEAEEQRIAAERRKREEEAVKPKTGDMIV